MTSLNTPPDSTATDAAAAGFSPVDNEAPLRWQRLVRLAPAGGLGVGRRAVFYALLTWLPIVVWAAATGHLMNDGTGERLLQHYGIHVRCLVAIPLFILAEAALHKASLGIVAQFLDGGLIAPVAREQFKQVHTDMRRLRDTSLPWVFVLVAVLAWSIGDQPDPHADAMAWAYDAEGSLGFGGWWFALVARPIFLVLLFGWLWRIALVAVWFVRIGRLELSLVPTHPDRLGGLGFLEKLPGAFALVTFAVSAVFASRWAHEVVIHGATLDSLKLPVLGLVLIWSLLMLLPLLVLAPALAAAKRKALAAYSALVAEQGRLVHRRWILREPVESTALLDAPEIGPVADANAMFDAVKAMRPLPIGRKSLLAILLPMALPLLILAALQVPLKTVLLKLVKTLL